MLVYYKLFLVIVLSLGRRIVTGSIFDVQKLASTQNGVEFNFLKNGTVSSNIKSLKIGEIAIVGDRE